jgi:hypothetical protein
LVVGGDGHGGAEAYGEVWGDELRNGGEDGASGYFPWKRQLLDQDTAKKLWADGRSWHDIRLSSAERLVAMDDLVSEACVVVMAEPGAGKTVILRQDAARRREAGALVLGYDLVKYQTEGLVLRDIIRSDDFVALLAADGERYVYLDGFDESEAVQATLPKELSRALEEANREGLHFRIGTRPSSHLATLVELLCRQSGVTSVYWLAPPTEDDVRTAASLLGLDGDSFLAQVNASGVGALAQRPLVLKLLLKEFVEAGALSSSQSLLFARHIESLCRETRETLLNGAAVTLDERERVAIAGRVAAISALANRPTIGLSADDEGWAGVLTLSEVGRGEEVLDGSGVRVDRNALHETLTTPLFIILSPQLAGWTHLSYRDYLAADWIVRNELTVEQALDLVTTGDPRRLVPQLYDLASWLAVRLPGFLEAVLHVDPEVVLLGDALDAASRNPTATVEALLKAPEAERLLSKRPLQPTIYQRLNHPGLLHQLSAVLRDKAALPRSGILAMLIARACKVEGLDARLTEIALDESLPIRVRNGAVAALRDVGIAEARNALRPLLQPDANVDTLGLVLDALWPSHVSPQEVFSLLGDGRILMSTHVSSLTMFVVRNLVPGLDDDGLGVALGWIGRLPADRDQHYTLRDLTEKLATAATVRLRSTTVRQAFYDLLVESWTEFRPLGVVPGFADTLVGNTIERRELLMRVFSSERPASVALGIAQIGPSATHPEDVEWLVEAAQSAMTETAASATAAPQELVAAVGLLLRQIVWTHEVTRVVDLVFSVRDNLPGLQDQLVALFGPVPVDQKPVERRHRAPERPSVAALAQTLRKVLADVAAVDVTWARLVNTFTEAAGESIPGESLLANPLWAELSAEERNQVAELAKAFLEQTTLPPTWYESSTIPGIVLLGQSALRLLVETAE